MPCCDILLCRLLSCNSDLLYSAATTSVGNIWESLTEIAALAPRPDLRTAVPHLRALSADHILVNAKTRRDCVTATREA